jgi:hypothetical protein
MREWKPDDVATTKCARCDGGPVVFTVRAVPDLSMGQPFIGAADRVESWICDSCDYEHDRSFEPYGPPADQ